MIMVHNLIDPKKKEVVLQRIKDGKSPFCAEKPETEQGRIIQPSSTYADNDLGKEIAMIVGGNDLKVVRRSYRDAAMAAAANNVRLPSHVLHDEYLIAECFDGIDKLNELKEKNYYPAWAREILAYPERDGVFVQGKDIVDSETGWTLRANYVPEEAIGVKGVGLFIDPDTVTKEIRLPTVIPRTIIILRGMLQVTGKLGKVDPTTRIPLEVDDQLLAQLPEKDKRFFCRVDGVGVRPLVRSDLGLLSGSRGVNCNLGPYSAFGVGGVKIE
jgi:hypothetical protein